MHHRHRPSSPHPASRSRTGLLVLLCIAQLMVILDISAVNVALPDMAKDLDISGGDIGWTITSYSLIFGSLLLLGGRAADLLGRRRVFLAGLGVFTLASLASALAGGAATLFAARAGQGLGAAMLSPAALSIIMAAFTQGGERAKALGAWGAVGGAGAASACCSAARSPSSSTGALIFLINLPVGLALAAGALRIVPADTLRPAVARPRSPRRAARHAEPRRARLRRLAGRHRGLGLDADARARCRGTRGARRLRRARAPHSAAAAARAAPRRSRRRRRVADDARRLGRAVRHLPAQLALHAERARHRPARERPRVPARWPRRSAIGVHLGTHVISHAGVRVPLAGALAVAAGGMLLLTGVDAGGSYAADLLPGMLDRRRRPGRRARRRLRLRAHGRRRGGDRDALRPQHHRPRDRRLARHRRARHDRDRVWGSAAGAAAALAGGIGDAFLVAAALAAVASVLALAILPSAASFLPKLRLAPPVSVH